MKLPNRVFTFVGKVESADCAMSVVRPCPAFVTLPFPSLAYSPRSIIAHHVQFAEWDESENGAIFKMDVAREKNNLGRSCTNTGAALLKPCTA